MSCVSNADAIEDDLAIVENSFCPSAHDQFDRIPSLEFVSDFEYSNGKFSPCDISGNRARIGYAA